MLQKIIYFIKYNNGAVIILAVILILGGGAFAAGPEAIGQKQTSVQGVDDAALLAADLGAFNMDFKIENLEQDEKYYYATYSFLDLALADGVWQYQLNRKTRKISKKIKQDLGAYLAEFLAKHYEARIRELKREKSLAEAQGGRKRIEVTEYSGLIGRALDLAAKVFPGYEPVKKVELPAPDFDALTSVTPPSPPLSGGGAAASGADNLTRIYNDYVAAHPEVFNLPAGSSAGNESSSTPSDLIGSPQAQTKPEPLVPSQAEAEATSVEIIDRSDGQADLLIPAPAPLVPSQGEAEATAIPAPELEPEPEPAPVDAASGTPQE